MERKDVLKVILERKTEKRRKDNKTKAISRRE
jgi:hypothetical protein